MGAFLIGLGVGSLMVAAINYFENPDRSMIPNKFILATGVTALIAGLIKVSL